MLVVGTPKSLQGHIKVTARTDRLKTAENIDFSTIMFTLVVYDGLKHT